MFDLSNEGYENSLSSIEKLFGNKDPRDRGYVKDLDVSVYDTDEDKNKAYLNNFILAKLLSHRPSGFSEEFTQDDLADNYDAINDDINAFIDADGDGDVDALYAKVTAHSKPGVSKDMLTVLSDRVEKFIKAGKYLRGKRS